MATEDYYYLLGIEKTATMADIKTAYRKLARKTHPDAHPKGKDVPRFTDIHRAYTILSDPVKREAYDSGRGNALTDDPRGVLAEIWRNFLLEGRKDAQSGKSGEKMVF